MHLNNENMKDYWNKIYEDLDEFFELMNEEEESYKSLDDLKQMFEEFKNKKKELSAVEEISEIIEMSEVKITMVSLKQLFNTITGLGVNDSYFEEWFDEIRDEINEFHYSNDDVLIDKKSAIKIIIDSDVKLKYRLFKENSSDLLNLLY